METPRWVDRRPKPTFQFPRYKYCVHVDADVLDTVVNRAPKLRPPQSWQVAYVNLVKLHYEGFPQQMYGSGVRVDEEAGEDEEVGEDKEADKDEEVDMNFVKVPLDYLDPQQYNHLYDPSTFEHFAMFRGDDGVSIG
ncbi:hypothetical protein BKA66DRAFT_577138 [Pyrenochaeta sp. MPI-SDFR-AT-0127]|nr:hypothetical protein BKA66DRAFT_577138 [Pyrenochaeta sp. MPI-SDFR-AT-0127]